MIRKLSVFLLVFIAFSGQAQTISKLVNMGKDYINKPVNADSTYIYQLPARFSFALTNKLQMIVFLAYSEFKIFESIPASSTSYLGERLYKKVGFEIGYGGLSLGYDVEVGRHSAENKRAISVGMQNLKWGARVSYFILQNYIISNMVIGDEESEIYEDITESSSGLGKLRNISLDGYYVFNNKRFAYTATGNVNVLQKHTAGSFMLASCFSLSDLDTKEDLSGLFESFSTIQFALGGGYSINAVLWNRDVVNNDDKTARNLTFNITAMPVISLVNYMQTRAYSYTINIADSTESESLKTSNIWCYPSPNLLGSAAINLTWGHFHFTTQFKFNFIYFSSHGAIKKGIFQAPNIHIDDFDSDLISNVSIYGFQYDWMLTGKLIYRF